MADIQKDTFTTSFRVAVGEFWTAYQKLLALNDEFMARGWSGSVSDADINGANYDITSQQLSNALGTVAAVDTLLDAGDKTNLAKVLKR